MSETPTPPPDAPEPDPSRPDLESLLEPGERPASASVQPFADRVVLRLPTPGGLSRHTIPSSGVMGAVVGVLVFGSVIGTAPPEPFWSIGILVAALFPVLFMIGAAVAHVAWAMVRAKMVARIELKPHSVVLMGENAVVLWKGSVHELGGILVHHDFVSAILGLKDHRLSAFRIHGAAEARWTGQVLMAWKRRHAREGVDADYERVAALAGARASQTTG